MRRGTLEDGVFKWQPILLQLIAPICLLCISTGTGVAAEKPHVAPTLCGKEEKVYFSCGIGKKTVSLCGSPVVDEKSGYLQYRFGLVGKNPDLTYPQSRVHPRGYFRNYFEPIAAQTFSYEIGFDKDDYSYRIFGYTAARASSLGWGVFVKKKGERTKILSCTSPKVHIDKTALLILYDRDLIERVPQLDCHGALCTPNY